MSRYLSVAIYSSVMLIALASNAFAHAFHITVAEADVNQKTGRIEVAMRVHPGDLELALGRIANRRIRLEKEPKIDILITDYLQRSVQLRPASSPMAKSNRQPTTTNKPTTNKPTTNKPTTNKPTADKPTTNKPTADKSKPPKIKWVGKEVSVKWAWLYFEIPAVKELDGATFTNSVFHEILADQENTIILKDDKRKQTIVCRKDKATVTIDLRRTGNSR